MAGETVQPVLTFRPFRRQNRTERVRLPSRSDEGVGCSSWLAITFWKPLSAGTGAISAHVTGWVPLGTGRLFVDHDSMVMESRQHPRTGQLGALPGGDRTIVPEGLSAATERVLSGLNPVEPRGSGGAATGLSWAIGPSTTWLLRRLSYGLEVHRHGFDLDLSETARALGLGERMGKNAPFRRALQRLCTFELARAHGPGGLAVRTVVPPLPLRLLGRLPESLQVSHRRWASEQRLPEPEQMRRRARRLAVGLSSEGRDRSEIERQLHVWQFHPAVAFRAADEAVRSGSLQPGSAS